MIYRWLVLVGILAVGVRSGGFVGGITALIVFGIFCITFYTACDAWGAITGAMNRPRISVEDHSQQVHVHTGESRPGQPTEIEWAAVVEVARQHRPKGIQGGY